MVAMPNDTSEVKAERKKRRAGLGKYRKIYPRVWSDERFRELSAPKPNAQTLWFFLLTGPHTSNIPGLLCIGEAALAESLRWSMTSFRRRWKEIESAGMAEADWRERVIWVPRAIIYNEPESPNVVRSWGGLIPDIPPCALKDKALDALLCACESIGPSFEKAWYEAMRKAYPKANRPPSLNQKPEPEPEHKQEHEQPPIAPQGAGGFSRWPQTNQILRDHFGVGGDKLARRCLSMLPLDLDDGDAARWLTKNAVGVRTGLLACTRLAEACGDRAPNHEVWQDDSRIDPVSRKVGGVS